MNPALPDRPAPDTLAPGDCTCGDPAAELSAANTLAAAEEPAGAAGPPALSVPDFEVLERIGSGGMGVVWLVRQRSLDRRIAVKTLNQRQPRRSDVDAFRREALVTGRLEHPGIPPVHLFGVDEHGQPFLGMKLVQGRPWAALLEPRSAPDRQRAATVDLLGHLEILQRVCEAVDFAHAHGIIHRDLKPENVVVGEFGEVQLIDWGIALELAQRGTASGKPVGTPCYMAPEMAAGDEPAMGPRTDVYQLGGLLYCLLSGTPPHLADTTMGALTHAFSGKIDPLALRAPGRAIPQDLAELALRALARLPQDRFASAREFKEAVAGWVHNEGSRQLVAAALVQLELAERDRQAATAPPTEVYGSYSACTAGFERALQLHPGNQPAVDGLRQARLGHARHAITQGDLTVAEALLRQAGAEAPGAAAVWALLATQRAAAARRERRRRGLLLLVAALALVATLAGVEALLKVRAMLRRSAASEILTNLYGTEGPAYRVATLERALQADPSWADGHFQLALALTDRALEASAAGEARRWEQDQRRALEVLGRGLALGLGARGDYQRGQIEENLGERQPAIVAYRRAALREPDGFYGLAGRAAAALLERRPAEVIPLVTRAVELEPMSDATLFRRAQARMIIGDWPGVVADCSAAIAVWHGDPAYWIGRARARQELGDGAGAARDVLSALRRGPGSALVFGWLARRALAEGEPARGKLLAERAVAASPRSAELQLVLAWAHRAAGDRAGAARALQRAEELERDLPELREERRLETGPAAAATLAAARRALQRGDLPLAARLAEELARRDGSPRASVTELAVRVALARGDEQDARRQLEQAIAGMADGPERGVLLRWRATLARRGGDGAAAAKDALRAFELGDHSAAALRERAFARAQAGQTERAAFECARALRQDGLDVEARLLRARLRSLGGDAAGAASDRELARRLAPERPAEGR